MSETDFFERKKPRDLRKGWTTGACATASAKAAYGAILTRRFEDPITITLPRGETPSFPLHESTLDGTRAMAAIVKDAGDDPDVTHGALIRATVWAIEAGAGVRFRAGEGVGTVTLPGLPVAVGEPAINPVPRRMMEDAIRELATQYDAPGDVEITISVVNGEKLAERTMNGRIGIKGGLSILGTTGIVTPYSCAAWIASIHQGVDVARAAGLGHVAGSTGKTSEGAVSALYGLEEQALLEMGDFAGGLLKYLRKHPVARLTIAGGFAKISKLAQGHMDLHSDRSEVDIAALSHQLAELGAPAEILDRAKAAHSAGALLPFVGDLPLADNIAAQALDVVRETMANKEISADVVIFDRDGGLLGRAGPDDRS